MLFTLKLLLFMNNLTYLNLGLCLPHYALFSNHNHGYANLSKRAGVFNHLFLYQSLFKYCYKYTNL